MDKVTDLDLLQERLDNEAVRVGNSNILFFDLSSNCTGYTLASVDFSRKSADILNSGVIWFNNEWDVQEKIGYLSGAINNYFNICAKIDYCVCEAFMISMKHRSGVLVSPMLHGAVACALQEINVKYATVPISTWRKHFGIKKDETGDFKEPCRKKVEEYVKLPTEVVSNITGNLRQTPSDLSDSIGICVGSLKKLGITRFNFNKIKFQESINI